MASNRSNKDKAMASMLKARGITRKTGACPWGCGRQIENGGGPLIAHLGRCRGANKTGSRAKSTNSK